MPPPSPASRRLVAALGVLAVVVAAYAAWQLVAAAPPQRDISYATTSAEGLYQVSVESDRKPIPVGETHRWVLTVLDEARRPVEGAEIAMDGGMPAHGHGLPTAPRVTEELGEGRYRIEGVRFNMGGLWELRFTIRGAPGDDEAVFNIEL